MYTEIGRSIDLRTMFCSLLQLYTSPDLALKYSVLNQGSQQYRSGFPWSNGGGNKVKRAGTSWQEVNLGNARQCSSIGWDWRNLAQLVSFSNPTV